MKNSDWLVLLPTQADFMIHLTEKEEERFLLALYGRSRRSIVGSQLDIPKKAGDEFWKTYLEFQERKRRIADLKTTATLTDTAPQNEPKAGLKKRKNLGLAKERSKLYRKFQECFSKLLGKKQTVRLLQIDLQLDSCLASIAHYGERAAS